MNIHTKSPVCNLGQYIYVTGSCNFFFVLQDLIDTIISYFQKIAFKRKLLLTGFSHFTSQVFLMKINSVHWNGAVYTCEEKLW